MTTIRLNRYWALVFTALIAVIIISAFIICTKYSPNQPVEISLETGQKWHGMIYIDGAVNNPGIYPFNNADNLKSLIEAAGGISFTANPRQFRLIVPVEGEESTPQKIDINRAEMWLLEALPGIGETLASRIVDYRRQNGPFNNTSELLEVSGIGIATYEQIKDYITVSGF